MRRGCISLGEVHCAECHSNIPYPERYLAIEEKDGLEDEEGEVRRYCIACSLAKGYAHYKVDKGEQVLTFFEK